MGILESPIQRIGIGAALDRYGIDARHRNILLARQDVSHGLRMLDFGRCQVSEPIKCSQRFEGVSSK